MNMALPQQSMFKKMGRIYRPNESPLLLDNLIQKVDWQYEYFAFGRRFDVPRLQAWYADEGVHYRHSDNMLQRRNWHPALLTIKQHVEAHTQLHFNSVLVTYYRSGDDHVSWHADDEAELGAAPMIASLSLGVKRRFEFRHKLHGDIHHIYLNDGELLLMLPDFQQYWEHSVPPEPEISQPRINLTFRQVVMVRDEAA